MSRKRGFQIAGVAALGGTGVVKWWKAVGRGGDVEFLMEIGGPLLRLLVQNAEVALLSISALLLLLSVWPRPLDAISRRYRGLHRRWKLRHWTDGGLNWRVPPESHKLRNDGQMVAVLAISPMPGIELPQPLDIIITSPGNIIVSGSAFHPDPAQKEDPIRSGDVEVEPPGGKMAAVRLRSPKLTPPARWDLTLTMAGGSEVKITDVRRAPRRNGAPDTRLH